MIRRRPPALLTRRLGAAQKKIVSPDLRGTNGRRAVFFDRDGTLNEEIGHVRDPQHFRVYPFAARAVRLVNRAGLLAIVITNQSGVGRGLFAEAVVRRVHRQLAQRIEAGGGRLDAIFYCPHHPEALIERYRIVCSCRKPAPGMLEKAAEQFGIDLENSFVIGDRFVDIAAGKRVGARSVLVLSGVGRTELEDEEASRPEHPDYVAENVYAAVRWILGKI